MGVVQLVTFKQICLLFFACKNNFGALYGGAQSFLGTLAHF
jgi:hypothetical protein